MSDRHADEVRQIVRGAIGISLTITAFGLLLHFGGPQDLFRSGWWFVWDVVYGYASLVVTITITAGAIQWLSYRTRLPPIVEVDDE